MTLLISGAPVPLRTDEAGVIRVGKTRVSLDSVICDYRNGATAEQIAFDYPTLDLADIHLVIAYYLRHRADVEEYLAEQRVRAEEVRKQVESIVAAGEIRERLLSRRRIEEGRNATNHGG